MDRHTINLEFFASYELFEQIPSLDCLEIAFVGASNSGKSSAINLLANNKKLSYTSKKPGKTKLFNYFKKDNNFIVDFPGYGFANISKSQIKSWQRELPRYFEERENLKYAFLFIDSNSFYKSKKIKETDIQMIEYLNKLNLPFHIVLTKIDKLKNGQIIEVSKSFEENFQSFYLLSNKDIRLVTTLAKKIDKLI